MAGPNFDLPGDAAFTAPSDGLTHRAVAVTEPMRAVCGTVVRDVFRWHAGTKARQSDNPCPTCFVAADDQPV